MDEQQDHFKVDSTAPSPYKCFFSLLWWRNVMFLAVLFAKHCLTPACLWLASLATFLLPSAFIVVTFGKTITMIQLVQAMVVYIVTLFLAVPLLFWCFGGWLVRLTAFSASLESFSRSELLAGRIDNERILQTQKTALDHVKTQKLFLAKFWSTLTIFLMLPCIVFFFSMLTLSCTSPSVLGSSALHLPPVAMALTYSVCLISGLLITVVSFAGISVSSRQNVEPVKHARRTIFLSAQNLIPLSLITTFAVFLSVLVTSPQELLEGGNITAGALNVSWISVAQEVWRAISSTIMWTITLAPVCEFMRGKQIPNE